MDKNLLYYGDNLDVLRRHIPDESIDLVYLDPPFNSNRSYNVLFANRKGSDAQAQIEAFDDTWTWSPETEGEFAEMVQGSVPARVADAIQAMRRLIGENDVLAYLVMMTPRLVELQRVLRDGGSLYLHCDQTASHYLKVILDAVFGPRQFIAEITWLRTTTHSDAKRWSPNADVILHYHRGSDFTWNPVYQPYSDEYIRSKYRHVDADGRHFQLDNMTSPNPRPNLTYEWRGHEPPTNGWRYSKERMAELDADGRIWYPDSTSKRPRLKRYLDEMPGALVGNVWTDISPINSRAAERLGYPTQKPLALLERIVRASSDPGDVVLDPFCGCGTTVDAAENLGRSWIGIDVTYLAIDLIEKRLLDTHGEMIAETYEVRGIPRDVAGARALFGHNPFDFERWAVSLLDGEPNEKQVGDRGIDGVIRLPGGEGKNDVRRALISVKGGRSLNPAFVRDLIGTVDTQSAEMGVLVTLHEPTKGMIEAANHAGTYTSAYTGQTYPRIQLVTIGQLLAGNGPKMPPAFLPYIKAQRLADGGGRQDDLFSYAEKSKSEIDLAAEGD